MNTFFIHMMTKNRAKNIYTSVCTVLVVIFSLFSWQVSALSWECPFSNINGTTVNVCFVASTGAIFTQVRYLKNWSYPFDSSFSTFNPINQGIFTVQTSTGTNIWFRVSIGTAMSGSIYYSDAYWPTGATWATWPTGATWPTWATWSQGNDGYNAFEIAQILWYTGTVTEWFESLKWPMGATWTIDFTSFSWAVNLQNIVNVPDNDGTLNSWSTYIPIKTTINGVDYYDSNRITQLLMKVWFVLLFSFMIWWAIFKKFTKKSRYE